jgi:hypothetical protein
MVSLAQSEARRAAGLPATVLIRSRLAEERKQMHPPSRPMGRARGHLVSSTGLTDRRCSGTLTISLSIGSVLNLE